MDMQDAEQDMAETTCNTKQNKEAICPNCKKAIDHITFEEMVWAKYDCSIKDGDLDFSNGGEIFETADPNQDNVYYNCSECGEMITDKYDVAKKFLLTGILD